MHFNSLFAKTSIHTKHVLIQRSLYHHTAKREILPLLGIATVALIGRYSYRALVRMDEEWEDYQEALKRFQDLSANTSHDGTVGIDMGSLNLRLAHFQKNVPVVIENHEGSRYSPGFIVFDDTSNSNDSILIGTMAKNKFYERAMYKNMTQVRCIRDQLSSSNNNTTNDDVLSNDDELAIQKSTYYFLFSNLSNALEKITGIKHFSAVPNEQNPLFSIDSDATNKYNARPIFTYNPSMSKIAKVRYQLISESLCSPPSMAAFVPEPVAAAMGAKDLNILSSISSGSSPIAILDIGGHILSLSILEPASGAFKIIHHISIPEVAGHALQNAFAHLLQEQFCQRRNNSDTSPPPVLDGMAMQRIHEASEVAIMELSRKTRANVNIPYLSIDSKTMQPKHLETEISREVLKKEMDYFISNHFENDTTFPSSLNASINNVSSLITSIFFNSMEQAKLNPFALDKVLLIGGGARSPIFQQSVREGLVALGGEAFADDKLVIPEEGIMEELVVLGAAICGKDGNEANYNYEIGQEWSSSK